MRMLALYRWTSQVIEDGFSDFTICMYSSRYKQYVCVCVGHIHTCGFFLYSMYAPIHTCERAHTQGHTNIYIHDNIREILVTSPKVRAILLSQKETSLIRHKFPCIRWRLCIIAPNSQHMWLTTVAVYYCTCDPGLHHASKFSTGQLGVLKY